MTLAAERTYLVHLRTGLALPRTRITLLPSAVLAVVAVGALVVVLRS